LFDLADKFVTVAEMFSLSWEVNGEVSKWKKRSFAWKWRSFYWHILF